MAHSKDEALSLGPGMQPPAISSRPASSIAGRIAPQENGAGAAVIQQHPGVVHGVDVVELWRRAELTRDAVQRRRKVQVTVGLHQPSHHGVAGAVEHMHLAKQREYGLGWGGVVESRRDAEIIPA
jgi:hypothetical protein